MKIKEEWREISPWGIGIGNLGEDGGNRGLFVI
jgi:hypothetical protein